MGIRFYDTSLRSKSDLVTAVEGEVTMYVCGPTVYDDPHLGHARSAIAFDVIRRVLEASGYKVRFVRNITDVDDKILNRAKESGSIPEEVAEEFTRAYDEGMRKVGVRPPNISPKATQHIADMQELISKLIAVGAAYQVDSDVYFAIDSFPQYGSLSGRSLDEMRAGERVEVDDRKRNPMDFALWKGAKENDAAWPSPWGPGRPGWHIECSAMAMKYLGETFDIHGGGADLLFPHHENEAAQSTAVTGKPLARTWIHNGFVTLGAEKMSKSLKNYLSLEDVLNDYPAPAVRLLFATSHYRSQIEATEQALTDAKSVWEKIAAFARNAVRVLGDEPNQDPDDDRYRAFLDALQDDVNAPEAMVVVHELIAAGNAELAKVAGGGDSSDLRQTLSVFRACTGVLGLDPIGDWPESALTQRMAPLVEALLAERAEARASKDFPRADRIRDALASAGIVVEDGASGVRWHIEDAWS